MMNTMIFRQYYLECLSHASYLIGDDSSKLAVVVDPQRDIDLYLQDAQEHGLTISKVIETHFHADFLSGHLELAEATGADICYGPPAVADYPIKNLADGEVIELGEVRLEVMHTPGHTPESICLLFGEESDFPYGVLTGDTLFIGDVGRPDLLASIGVTADELANSLFDSIQRLSKLPEQTRVFPAHGAGSACGRSLSTELSSTIKDQLLTNYAMRQSSREDFIAAVTENQPAAPPYFVFDAVLNRKNRELLDDDVVEGIDLARLLELQAAGARIIDTRENAEFSTGHLKGSINVGLGGRFAEYAGAAVTPDEDIVLVTAPGTETEAKTRLARIGFDNVVGSLVDPMATMFGNQGLVTRSRKYDSRQLGELIASGANIFLLDVRNPGEIESGGIQGAVNIPAAHVRSRLDEIPTEQPIVVYCAGGYRSGLVASLLEALGYGDVSDLVGGFTAWQAREVHATA